MHVPVLLDESLGYLAIRQSGTYLDATAGLGGHVRAIAERATSGLVIGADRDAESLEKAERFLNETGSGERGRVSFLHARFSQLRSKLMELGIPQVDGLLADLGVSRWQLTEGERGFSLMAEGPLDMRMDRSQPETAADIVNFASPKELADLIYRLGEERRSHRISRAIVRARPIRSTAQLARVIEEAVPRTGRLHPATQTFMALRLEVNSELQELESLLEAAPAMVRAGGRVVVITFMSLEDRRVKEAFRKLERESRAAILTKHVIRPSVEEIGRNPASRSAKLRAVEIK